MGWLIGSSLCTGSLEIGIASLGVVGYPLGRRRVGRTRTRPRVRASNGCGPGRSDTRMARGSNGGAR